MQRRCREDINDPGTGAPPNLFRLVGDEDIRDNIKKLALNMVVKKYDSVSGVLTLKHFFVKKYDSVSGVLTLKHFFVKNMIPSQEY